MYPRGGRRAAPSSARRVAPLLACRPARARRDRRSPLIRERLAHDDAQNGFVLDGFPRNLAQAEALDAMLEEIDRPLSVVLLLELSDEVSRERLTKRAAARRPCRRQARGDREAAAQLPREDGAGRRALPRNRQACTGARASVRSTRSGPRSPTRSSSVQARRMIIRKSAAEIEGHGARRRARPRDARALRRGARARPDDARARPHRRGAHRARRAACPTSKGYKGFPAALCISPNSMVVHGIPTEYRAQEGDLISVDLGVTLNGLVADSAVTLPVGEITRGCAAAARRLPGGARGRHRAGAGRQPPVGHLPRRPGGRRGGGLLGRPEPRRPRRRPLLPRGPADPEFRPARAAGPVLQEGMTLAIEPMITAGRPRRLRPRRRLVDLVGRRVARGPLRAHRCGDCRRAPDPHESRSRFATMIARRAPALPCARITLTF